MDPVDLIGAPGAVAGTALFEHPAIVDGRLAGTEAGPVLLHMLLCAAAVVAGGADRGGRGDDAVVERAAVILAGVDGGSEHIGRQGQGVAALGMADQADIHPAVIHLFLLSRIEPVVHVHELGRFVTEYLPDRTDLSEVAPRMEDTTNRESAHILTLRRRGNG